MSKKSVRTVKTISTSSVSGGGSGSYGSGLGSVVGGNFASNSVLLGSGGSRVNRGRYASSLILPSTRQMSYGQARSSVGVGSGMSSTGYGAGGILFSGGSGFVNAPTISNVQVNRSLLTPVPLDIDSTLYDVRNNEKNQIKGLNNRFAGIIDKVSDLTNKNVP